MLVCLSSLSAAGRLRAEDLPLIAQSLVSTPGGGEGNEEPGLLMLRLPLESRTSVTDYVGRNFPSAALTSDGQLRLRGGRPEDTAIEIDGIRFRRLTLPVAMIQRFDVASAGYGPEWADVLGGVVGVTTRSGSNRWHVDADAANDFHDHKSRLFSGLASGPIVRDRLFFVVAPRLELTRDPDQSDFEGVLPDAPGGRARNLGGALKVTWIPRDGQRLESLTLLDDLRSDYGAPATVTSDAQPSRGQRAFATALRWSGRVGRVAAYSQAAFQNDRAEEMPVSCRDHPGTCDSIAPRLEQTPRMLLQGSWTTHRIDVAHDWQVKSGVEVPVVENAVLRQRVRLQFRLNGRTLQSLSHAPGDVLTSLNGSDPGVRTTTFANDPRIEPARYGWFSADGSSLETLSAVESQTRLFERLWIVPGLALAASRAHTDLISVNELGVVPQLGVGWDAFGNGATWLHASSRQRVSAGAEGLLRSTWGSATRLRCRWNDSTAQYDRECTYSGGSNSISAGLPCSPTNVGIDGAPCNQPLRMSRSWEHTAGLEQNLGRGVRLAVDLVYRRAHRLPETAETNRVWNSIGLDTSGYRNGRAQTIVDYSTRADGYSRYLDLTVALRRDLGALRLLAAYVYSADRSNVVTGALPTDLQGGTTLVLTGAERPHSFRALVSYDLAGYAALGLVLTRDSGAPYSRVYASDSVVRGFEDYRAVNGQNPGTNLNDPGDDRPIRTPAVTRANLQLRLRGKRVLGADLDLYADLIDVIHDSKVTFDDSPDFVNVSGRAVWTRLGLEYHY
jgi:hypothetical protein